MISRLLKPPKTSALLFGPRMTGKSTWLRHHCKDWLWIDLLREANFQLYLAEPGRLRKEVENLEKKVPGIVIDEIQRVPALLNEVQALIEERKIRFFLSGSSARKLKRDGANLLAGRAVELHLFPLTLQEIERAQDQDAVKKFSLESVLKYGSLPAVYLEDEKEKIQILRTYVSTYLREEIQAEGFVRNLPSFSKFLLLAAESCGQELNYTEISRETTVSSKTIREYFSILEDTWLGYLLMPWERSVRKQLAGSPKFFFFDNGVTNALRESLSSHLSNDDRGRLFEQWMINEIRAQLAYAQFEGSFYFWRVRGGSEVDLVLARGSKPVAAIEIKHTANPGLKHFSGLNAFADEYPNVPRYLVCTTQRSYVEGGVKVENYQEFLSNIRERVNGKIFE